ncbi:MAG: M20/M25/M40 family metallo-hydrolase [Bacteroidales bacterium]|nr:M20/M25/M40 family metallo-hydrolase [Bacteroidales bacterium]
MKKILFIILISIIFCNISAQDISYARSIISELSSQKFHGRGYKDGGIDSAACFIENQFKEIGLKPIEKTFFQEFNFPTNIFHHIKLAFDEKLLEPAIDYLPNIHSCNVSDDFLTIKIDEKIRNNPKKLNKLIPKIKGKVLFLNRFETKDKTALNWYDNVAISNPYNAAGIIVLDSSFTYNIAEYYPQFTHFLIQLAPKSFPEKNVKKVHCEIKKDYVKNFPAKNIVSYLQGQEYSDSFIVITAHYDHLGKLENNIFPGANDNASGIAMMLDLAKNIKQQNFRPRYSLVFIALTGEEVGLFGSKYFVDNPIIDLKKIKFLINLDMVGTGSSGISVVNATIFKEQFNKLKQINDDNNFITNISQRGAACNSDHCPFFEKGVPSFFIYTTGKEFNEYHNTKDKADSIPLTAYEGLFNLIKLFIYSF